jgi:hypothetical protein
MTVYNSDLITKNANRATHGESRVEQHAFATVFLAVALVANDTLQLLKLPPYARVTGACIAADHIDTNATGTIGFTVGDSGFSGVAADTSRYFAATSVGRVAGPSDANASAAMSGKAQNFLNAQPAPLTIFATVAVPAATFAAGNVTFRISYYLDEPASVLNQ